MKSYTNLEQSKKLSEILPIESADMRYDEYTSHIDGTPKVGYKEGITEGIPCWSLSALLRFFDDRSGLAKERGTWFAYNNNISYCTKHYTDEIDAVFEMILKLKGESLS